MTIFFLGSEIPGFAPSARPMIEVPKLVESVLVGPPADEAAVAKLVLYVLLVPGSDGGEDDPGQSQIFANVVRRPS